VILRLHGRKENQRVMNRQQSTSISGKHESENHGDKGPSGHAGRTQGEQAHQAMARLRQLNPALRVSTLKDVVGPYRAEDVSRYEKHCGKPGGPNDHRSQCSPVADFARGDGMIE
jgi:hypothetical protein